MRYLHVCRQGLGVNRESVVLRCYRYLAARQILDGLISAAMAEFQFKFLAAESQT